MNAKDKLISSLKLGVLFIGIAVAFSSCSTKVEKIEQERPNIIFLMDDQHRWDALGVENKAVITPALD